MPKYSICIDFDGVIHGYSKGWQGITNIYDLPVNGVKEFIEEARKEYKIIVHTIRLSEPDGYWAVSEWLKNNDIYYDDLCVSKPAAIAYIDDRGIRFEGKFDGLLESIRTLKPWWKRNVDSDL